MRGDADEGPSANNSLWPFFACVRASFFSPLGDLFGQLKPGQHCEETAACFSPTHLGLSQTT